MNIGVDMDSVIAEIIRPLDTFHNRKYHSNLTYEDHYTYDLGILWKCEKTEVFKRIFEYYESEEFLTVKPEKGSQKALSHLAKKHSLHLITSRPSSIETKSHRWLDAFFPNIFTTVTHVTQFSKNGTDTGNKKSQIGKKLAIDLMIDDHITYALDCAENGILTLLLDTPWNKKENIAHPLLKRVASWDDICYTISHESQKPYIKNRTRI